MNFDMAYICNWLKLIRREMWNVTRRNEKKIMNTYLEKIMNSRVFKFFQGHVIAHSHVLVSHGPLKPFPSKIFIFKKIHGNSSRRLGWGSYYRLGRSDSGRYRRVQIMNLDGWLLRARRDNWTRLDYSRVGRLMLCLLISSTTRKIFQIKRLG